MPKIHVVEQGECLVSIAGRHGFRDYKSIYDHPENADFRSRRPNPNLIFPGDKIFIPDVKPAVFECETGRLHRFVAHRPTRKLNLKMADLVGEPIAGAEYELFLDGDPVPRKGRTGDEGEIQMEIPFDARSATLLLAGHAVELKIGDLNPMLHVEDHGVSGIQARLANLGYYSGPVDGSFGEDTEAAIRLFQEDHDMDVDGVVTDELRSKLDEKHGV